MRNHLKVVVVLLTLCACVAGALWFGRNSRASNQPATTTPNESAGQTMSEPIEEKARKLKGADEAAIRELADAVFNDLGGSIPESLADSVKERLIRAEIKYRKKNKGTKEANIVRTVNRLANAFGAPDYAQTSALQVRIMRVKLMETYPSFIAQELTNDKKGLKRKVGQQIKEEVSPLEAFFITAVLIQQKMLNEDWQEAPKEWAANLHQKRFMHPPQKSEARLTMNPRNVDKRREMAQLVSNGVASLGVADALSLVDSSLTTLGIDK